MRPKLLFVLLLLSTLVSPSYALAYVDADFQILKEKSIMTDFREDDLVTRAEFAAVVVRLLEVPLTDSHSTFDDTKSHWSDRVVAVASSKGWINGKTDTLFYPDDHITGHEVNLILGRAGIPETVDDVNTPTKRGEIAAVALTAYKRLHPAFLNDNAALQVTNANAPSSTEVKVTFSDGKTVSTTVPALLAGRQTWETVQYNGETYNFTVTWQGSPLKTIKTFKTHLSVHAGEVENDTLLYLTYNADGLSVPLFDGAKVEFSSDDPHITADGYFNNTNDPLPVGAAVTYTATLKDRKGKVIDSTTTTATVVDTLVGLRPKTFKMLNTGTGKFWGFNYVTMQNDGAREPQIGMIVTQAQDVTGALVDNNIKADDAIEENIGDRTYFSSDERILKVDSTGKIIPVTPGIAKVGIICGDFFYTLRTTVYPEQIPTSLVYASHELKTSDTSFTFSIKDQFGQLLRTNVASSSFSLTSSSVDTSSAAISVDNGIISVSGVNLSAGQSTIEVFYNNMDLGQLLLKVRES